MQRLNIPLSRHRKTTRHNKRVVWLLVATAILAIGMFIQLTGRWYTRATILSAAPVDTIVAIHLPINPTTIKHQLQLLNAVPLISNRSLTLEDLLVYIDGDLGWFLLEDGTRAVAIRNSIEIPELLLKNFGLVAQETESGFTVLSETLLAEGGGEMDGKSSPFFAGLRGYIGQIVIADELPIQASLFIDDDTLVINTSVKSQGGEPYTVPSGTELFLSTAALPNILDSLVSSLPVSLNEFQVAERISELFRGEKHLLITNNSQNQLQTLIEFIQIPEETDPEEILRFISASNNPYFQEKVLNDGTVSKEIRVEPENITVAEISSGLLPVYQVAMNGADQMYASLNNESLVISTDKDLLLYWISPKEVQLNTCEASMFLAKTDFILEQISLKHIHSNYSFINTIFSRFSTISIEPMGGSMSLILSSAECG
ncbi:hypothetical protein CO174_04440 [Candidatus Uhrbacteria bacterium CG_4_9_14_3_um_filter_50_9]|uniref:Uncharacterized protein n=1 Tax=Candidatus Uhrbacteria bacterium CG_4_9_14_3_um_filter_50_9 TaxID=1975035 RepID=A0A2M7XBE7_9BACT|nr:MAG: hypothetical protein CO174_04440 [Candidatus Uhrbacteria bacterium CG_4_9_14_3_um_filter_50_9]